MSGESAKRQAEREVGPTDDKQKNPASGSSNPQPQTGHEPADERGQNRKGEGQGQQQPGQKRNPDPGTGLDNSPENHERNQGTGNGREKHQPGSQIGDESAEERRHQEPEEDREQARRR
jgi:hypothetical protein